MKTFVILLLLANLVYWGVNNVFQESASVALESEELLDEGGLSSFEQAPTQLKLVSEREEIVVADEQTAVAQVPEEKVEAAPEVMVRPVDVEADSVPWCAQSSNFSSEAQLNMLASELKNLGFGAEVSSGEVPVSYTYWVHMPDFSSEQEALRQLAELQGRGIDSYYMRSGELAGGISLGVFSRIESAELVRRNLLESGYKTEIGRIARQEQRYWLNLSMSDRAGLESPEWAAFSEALNPLNLSEKVCEVVASETQFP